MTQCEQPKILIVDDRPENLLAMQVALASVDAELHLANSGNEALGLTIRNEYALILLDVQMPEMDGHEVASLLQSRDATSSIPIIFVTALGDSNELRAQGYKVGAVDYLNKPVDEEILRSKVTVFLELYESKRCLEKKNSELQDFAHLAAHDLKAPLRGIRNASTFLSEDLEAGDHDDVDEHITQILKGAGRMSQLIDNLLEYAKAGRTDVDFKSVDLDDALSYALLLLGEVTEEANAKITATELPTILGNKTAIVQLLQNLVGNAIKFRRDETPVIQLGCEQVLDEWQFRLVDNGIGVESEHFDTVFAPLARLHGVDKFEGTGLGLANCRKIVESHSGRIWMESNGDEPGTCIVFTLPAMLVPSGANPG